MTNIAYNLFASIISHFAAFLWMLFGATFFLFLAAFCLNGWAAAVAVVFVPLNLLTCWKSVISAYVNMGWIFVAGIFQAVVGLTLAILGIFDTTIKERINHYPRFRYWSTKFGVVKMFYPGMEIPDERIVDKKNKEYKKNRLI